MGPGVRLAGRLNLGLKLGLMAGCVVVPLVYLMVVSMQRLGDDADYIAQEHAGMALGRLTVALVLDVQRHRGLTQRVVAGDAAAVEPLKDAAAAVAADLEAMDRLVTAPQGVDMRDRWAPLKTRLAGYAAGSVPADAASFAHHTDSVEMLRQWMLQIGERSGLVLDPEARSYFLMDVAFNAMLPTMESAGIVRGLGAGVLAAHTATDLQRAEILGQAAVDGPWRHRPGRQAASLRAGRRCAPAPNGAGAARPELLRHASARTLLRRYRRRHWRWPRR
jgi:hypothetical protein